MNCPPRLISKCYTPKVLWSQSDLIVTIRILLIDVSDYYLRVESDHLLFSTITNGKKYYLILYLFGPVIAEKTVHKNIEREIKIYLTKEFKWFKWLRLIRSKEKDIFITYDVNCISETNHFQKNYCTYGNVENIKRRYNIQYIRPPLVDEEDSDTDDENLDFLRYA
ncbi:PREDICTED: putative ATP-dependent RNA helicase TDRD12 [Dinoponera quadriceps]|uniref:RNA helicase n=1 Tax=Dinoponera quadriceps TaxID=609295 RepID=A0A6P3XLM3_DINQU|nr:PREDICTED: putative ATP-dependent RNA helicase TDRD12 [Dinoponera quadriceps]